MAAFFARVGSGSHFHRAASCLKAWRVPMKTNRKIFFPWNGDISARNYVTDVLTKRSSCMPAKFSGASSYNGVRCGSVPSAVQGAKCLSLWPSSSSSSSTSGNSVESELLQDGQTTAQTTNPFLQENAPDTMLDSEMLNDMADAVTSLGEPTLASLGLGGYSPTGLVQQALELMHVGGSLSWCASIAVLTIVMRVVCFPLIIKAQANTAKLNNIRPQMEEIQAQLRELANSYDAAAKATASLKLKQLYQDNGCHPLKSILAPLVQLPLFISFFIALRRMCYLPVESFKTGGYLWFQDLTVFDPYFILPVICSFSMLASLELGSEMGISNPTMKTMKTVMRIMAVAMIPLTAQFPAAYCMSSLLPKRYTRTRSVLPALRGMAMILVVIIAIFVYWITSNMFTVGQVALLTHPAARKAMGIPEMVAYQSDDKPGGFLENLKAGYKNSQELAYIKHAEKMKHQRQKALGEAPLEPTYEFNPRIKENLEMFQSMQNKDAQPNQPSSEPDMSVQQAFKPDPNFKPKRVKFNQEIFSGMMRKRAKKELQKKTDKLRNRPGATM